MKKNILIVSLSICLVVLIIVGYIFISRSSNDNTINIDKIISDSSSNDTNSIDFSNYQNEDINLDGKSITIDKGGVYTLSGTINNGSVIVDTNDSVKLVLNNVTITNNNGPAILIKNASSIVIELANNSVNTLEDGSNYSNTEYDGCIYSADDLTIEGSGKLIIKANYKDGIVSKDDLKIVSGNYEINANDDAIRGKDSVYIVDGNFIINANGDGIKSTNDTDKDKGYVKIDNGTFKITVKDDGIHAITILTINDGEFTINAAEGIEGTYVVINDGNINIDASDDGINAAKKSNDYTPTVEINGGNITIKMGAGDTDGIDSNGNLYINDGTINITANSPFDYDGEAKYNDGTIIVNGEKINSITNQMMGGGMDRGGMMNPRGDYPRR